MDQLVQLKGVKLAGVVLLKALPHPLKQIAEPGLVVADDEGFIGLTLPPSRALQDRRSR